MITNKLHKSINRHADMTTTRFLLTIALSFIWGNLAFSQKSIEKDFSSHFDKYGVQGCFMLYNESGNEFIVYNPVLCDSGFIPASTFKIPHALIALEEGIIKDTNQVIKWDGHEWPNQMWNMDQTLKTSIQYSCIWVYIGFARQIPLDRYYHYVRAFNYGNMDLNGPPDRFWLAGAFTISPRQQIEFLRSFYYNSLPVNKSSIDKVKDCIIIEKTDQYTFSGKTGGGVLSDTEYIMWLVGYLEKADQVYFYAMNFKSDDFSKDAPSRIMITRSIMKELGIL